MVIKRITFNTWESFIDANYFDFGLIIGLNWYILSGLTDVANIMLTISIVITKLRSKLIFSICKKILSVNCK
jgi:hypothetical protein